MRLPLCIDMEKETESEKIIADKKLKDLRILILGKSGENINLVESYLKSFGMQCEITSSELSAVSMLEAANGKDQNPFDLLIIDYETPDEGGFCFVEKIKKNGSISKMPKILMLLPMMENVCSSMRIASPVAAPSGGDEMSTAMTNSAPICFA